MRQEKEIKKCSMPQRGPAARIYSVKSVFSGVPAAGENTR